MTHALDMARFMESIAAQFTPEQQAQIEQAAQAEVQRVAADRAEAERLAQAAAADAQAADDELAPLMQDTEAVTRAGIVNGDTQAKALDKLRAWIAAGQP
jgi:hypothetical protein